MLKKKIKTGNDFLMSNRSIPLWITSLAFISANLGAQEVLGMAASGTKYGFYTAHFYWLGAAFAMLLNIILGLDFKVSVFAAAGIVLVYTYLGGLTNAVYKLVMKQLLIRYLRLISISHLSRKSFRKALSLCR